MEGEEPPWPPTKNAPRTPTTSSWALSWEGKGPPILLFNLNMKSAANASESYDLVVFECSKEKARDAIFYSYTKYINGFAATLEEEEAMEISSTSLMVL